MAKFNEGITGKISGKIGTVQFFPSKRGNIMRQRPLPVNSKTEAQQRVRHRMSDASRAWALVGFDMADKWNKFASQFNYIDKVGKELTYNGRDIFIMLNSNRLEINEDILLEPPQKQYPEVLNSAKAQIIAGNDDNNDIRLFFQPPINMDTKIIVYATRILGPGINFIKPCWLKKIAVLDTGFTSGSSVIKEYSSVFTFFTLKSARIAFAFRPVSVISGLAVQETKIKCAEIS